MSINNISGFLERFKNLQPSDKYIKDACITSVKEIYNIEIFDQELKVQGNTIFLSVHPALKTEIYLQKKNLLNAIEEKLGKKIIQNIV